MRCLDERHESTLPDTGLHDTQPQYDRNAGSQQHPPSLARSHLGHDGVVILLLGRGQDALGPLAHVSESSDSTPAPTHGRRAQTAGGYWSLL